MVIFFMDDNFAINVKRTKSLLRDIIVANAQVHWIAQISANLLRDEELLDLIAASGGPWIFIGMESIDPTNLASVNKGLKKPGEYSTVLKSLADRNIYAITSFILAWITTRREWQVRNLAVRDFVSKLNETDRCFAIQITTRR